jgi:transposase
LRVVGIDDWAWRKGCQYGTVICDLERRRIVALLPDRASGASAASWLRDHPSIEFIARDRGASYGDAALVRPRPYKSPIVGTSSKRQRKLS